jgi:hypothetical protein
MPGPDGYEEREAEREFEYERDLDDLDIDQMIADEERHDAATLTAWPARIDVRPIELSESLEEIAARRLKAMAEAL